MKTVFLFLLLFLLSCGSGKDGSSPSASHQESLNSELTQSEETLISQLLIESPMRPRDVLKKLLMQEELSNDVLMKLDHYLSIECITERNDCFIERKK